MSKIKKPEHFSAPLQSRGAITEWLLDPPGWVFRDSSNDPDPSEHQGGWLYCYNVKLGRMYEDFQFEALMETFKKGHGDSIIDLSNPEVVAKCLEKYEEIGADKLCDWGCDEAWHAFVGCTTSGVIHTAQQSPGDDSLDRLSNGAEVDVSYTVGGRSAGWLILTWFNEHELACPRHEIAEYFEGWPYKDLRQLYQYLLEIDVRMRDYTPEKRVAECAAWALFANACHKVWDDLKSEKETALAATWP